ncbi:sugar transferase [Crateriforma conspicua]|uniref:Putative sugar transferase EpsL n=1 Tax=Crateriforma conspicua TaxID=2527996 RepID=A0A5C5Y6G1_9PLAN|nr:putative sugar transferase EpsL [Crateriforma conspicua]
MKRVLDTCVSTALLVGAVPFIFCVSVLVRFLLGTPIFFRQRRPGLKGKPFELMKFRTMTDARDPQGQLLPDDQRVTKLGRFLRSSSLDELPTLLNVIRGDMSLVGPRPLLMEYLPMYTAEENRRHEVRPGITGWAQVNGRNAIRWEEKFRLDVWYVDHQSLWLDLYILILTAWKVVRRSDISADGHATMPKFERRPSSNNACDPADALPNIS